MSGQRNPVLTGGCQCGAETLQGCTLAIGLMTLVIMFATILPLVHPH
jgi:hypothetical protein